MRRFFDYDFDELSLRQDLDLFESVSAPSFSLFVLPNIYAAPEPNFPLFADIDGTSGDDTLDGTADGDTINGFAGNDTINGLAGDDFLIGGEGNDSLDGGDGIDFAVFSNNQADYTVFNNNDGTFIIADNVGADGFDNISNIEFLRFADSDVDLTVPFIFTEGNDTADGSESDDVLDALGGNDRVNGLGGNDTIFGRTGDDILSGGEGDDTLYGNDGADSLFGDNGADSLFGGDGNDTLGGDLQDIIIDGGRGHDVLSFYQAALLGSSTLVSIESYQFYGSLIDASALTGRIDVNGTTGSDSFTGTKFSDFFRGEFGSDQIDGGDGIDGTIYLTQDNTVFTITINTTANGTIINYGTGSDTVTNLEFIIAGVINYSNPNAVNIIDGSSSDVALELYGYGFSAELIGGSDEDVLETQAVSSTIMTGNGGSDTFKLFYQDNNNFAVRLNNVDITDLSSLDVISFAFDRDPGFQIVYAGSVFTNTAREVISYTNAGQTFIDYDQDGDGIADQSLVISNGAFALEVESAPIGFYLYVQDPAQMIDGDALDNVIEGGGGDDTINGLAGDDTIWAGAGHDIIFGGDGNDDLRGGSGDDQINGGDGNDILSGGPGGDSFFGGAGNDFILTGVGTGQVDLGADDDHVVISEYSTYAVYSGLGNNIIESFSTNTTVVYRAAELGSVSNIARTITVGGTTVTDSAGQFSDTFFSVSRFEFTLRGLNTDLTFDASEFYGPGETYNPVTLQNEAVPYAIEVYAGEGNDLLTGSWGDDIIVGDEGDDILTGLAGDDSLEGGDGYDIAIFSGNQADYTVTGDDVSALITDNVGTDGTDSLFGVEVLRFADGDVFLSGNPPIEGTPGNDNLMGTVDADVINGLAGNDILNGLEGDDTINGGDGADRLIGGEGADALSGNAGFDSVDYRGAASAVRFSVDTGGTLGEALGDTFSGIERYYLSDFNDIITGSDANEFFYGENGNDQINGGGGIDRIYGGDGNDVQRGQDGNDTLYGSAGSDQLNGGVGFDIANYTLAAAGVIVNMLTGGTGGDAAGDTYFGIEAVYGSDFDDSLTGNNSVNELRGGDGDDSLFGLGGNDRFFGSAGADSFDGGTGIDSINFTLAESGVRLSLEGSGSAGDASGDSYTSIEWFFGSAFDDTVFGSNADNRIEGRDGNDDLYGEGGNDRILGGDGDDTILGGDGVDTIFGGNGDDDLRGQAGNDFFFGGAGSDEHNGGSGIDTVSYLASSEGLTIDLGGFSTGDAAGDTFTSIERIFGTRHDDIIIADSNPVTLFGNGGDDYLEGFAGDDSLIGGAGVDSYGYNVEFYGADVIQGFTVNEVIYLYDLGGGEYDTWAEVQAVGSDAGANVIFDFGFGNTLTIVGQSLADLDASNFNFSGIRPSAEPLSDPDAFAADVVDMFDMDALI